MFKDSESYASNLKGTILLALDRLEDAEREAKRLGSVVRRSRLTGKVGDPTRELYEALATMNGRAHGYRTIINHVLGTRLPYSSMADARELAEATR